MPWFIALLFIVLQGCSSPDTDPHRVGETGFESEPPSQLAVTISEGNLDSDDLPEASGMAISRRNPQLLWVHNDSGGAAEVWAVTTDGHVRGKITISDGLAFDWEDMASFELDGKPYLIIGDVGDNNAIRPSITFYIIEEPDISAEVDGFNLDLSSAWSISARYPDGARDCEGLAVDTSNETIILLSKRDDPARLYELPLRAPAVNLPVTLSYLGEVTSLPAPTAEDLSQPFGEFRHQVTALDIFPTVENGLHDILVVTYKDAYRFQRATGQSWLQALNGSPQTIDIPQMAQTESGGFTQHRLVGYVGSEQAPYPLHRFEILGF